MHFTRLTYGSLGLMEKKLNPLKQQIANRSVGVLQLRGRGSKPELLEPTPQHLFVDLWWQTVQRTLLHTFMAKTLIAVRRRTSNGCWS